MGVETAPNLPSITTTIVATYSTSVSIAMPEVLTSTFVPSEAVVISVIADSAVKSSIDGGEKNINGTFTDQTVKGNPETDRPCVAGSIFTVTLSVSQNELYLYALGLTSTTAISDLTTNFVPNKQS